MPVHRIPLIIDRSKQPSNEMEGVRTSTSSFASIMFRRNRSRNTRSSPQNDEKVDLMEIESAAAPNVGADSVVLDITRKKGRTMSPTCMEMSTSNTQELESHKLGVNSRFEDFSNGGGTNGGINSFNSSISSNNSSKNNNNNNNNENDDKSSGGDSSKNRSSNGSGRILSVCAELDVAGEVSDDTVLESGAGRAADASAMATLEVAKTAMAAGGHAEPLVAAGRDAESAEARESRLRPLAERTVPTRKVMCRQVCDVCESDDDVRYAPHSPLLYDPLVGILACKFCRDHFCVELSRASREADPFLPGSLLKVRSGRLFASCACVWRCLTYFVAYCSPCALPVVFCGPRAGSAGRADDHAFQRCQRTLAGESRARRFHGSGRGRCAYPHALSG